MRSQFIVYINLLSISLIMGYHLFFRMNSGQRLASSTHAYKRRSLLHASSSSTDKSNISKSKKVKEDSVLPFAMTDLVELCKRRGFIFQSSEIYSPLPGFFDYGPLGVELKNNIKKIWWREMVQRRPDVVGLDSSIIASSSVWEASGHVAGFSDPMVDCKETKQRFRADQVFWGKLETENDTKNRISFDSLTNSKSFGL